MKKLSIVISIFLITMSCSTKGDDYIFEETDLKNISLPEVISFEKEKGAKERLYDNTFYLDEGFFSNPKKFKLSNPRVFERKDQNLSFESAYFYSVNDSIIRAIAYMWQDTTPITDTFKGFSERSNIIEQKYVFLERKLSEKLGKSKEPNLGPGCYLSLVAIREWKSKEINVQLAQHTRNLRLTITQN